ncbi:adhesion G-protein coupled receptor F1-like [Salvelinus namaycush]|uniref:Adhesion G-protein coupled receptor F1-like n=1 Tax=Salvelinus namaycush TaxID=8040 RepID=A0A8U0P4L2_SALNM|nr:adhesion G-protein coupled receptor F1-like [Salvelinus namaycush]
MNRYPLPLIVSAFEPLQESTVFSKLDLRNAYHLVQIREEDEWKTTFNTVNGHYKYLAMPFGLINTKKSCVQECSSDFGGFRCRCEDQYSWSCDQCSSSQSCDEIVDGKICGCLNDYPSDGKFCQPITSRIVASPATISTIVNILTNVANVSQSTPINKPLMKNFLETAGVLTSNEAKTSWGDLNKNLMKNESSAFLGTIETISNFLTDDFFDIEMQGINLNKTTVNNSVNNLFNLNSSVLIDIPASEASFNSITIITFDSLYNVLPARNRGSRNNIVNTINGKVVLVKVNGTIKNVTFRFDVLNKTLANPQCVFWNFNLFKGLGGWDDKGCKLQSDKNGTVTCHCNHLTSFSILMSPFIPRVLRDALDFITYIGVGISAGCLVVCLIIEMLVWKAVTGNNTSYMRHVSIVNIAFSLLIADIWFIIGAAISDIGKEDLPACSTATFFIHFFYLALFFWMLVSGLLLLYRTVMVFSHMSKPAMLAISFSLGYGAPLIIAVITIAVTAPGKQYIRENDRVCWLNWTESMALLAFVIPALTIVVINLLILIVVLFKMLRRGVGDVTQPDERNAVVVIARCLAILTPFFGTTWGLGVGTMTTPNNLEIHIVFAIFNSLQGLFILVFGTLLDKKVCS